MNCEIIRIDEASWRIEDGGVRFFLLAGSERALLIDSGMNCRNARDIAAALTPLPLELLNTHADIDHIGSNAQFESFYMHPAEEPNYRRSGKPGAIVPIEDGDVLDLGGRRLEIIHLPGHTPGSVAVLDAKRRALISGDPIQEHGHIFMFGAHRNLRDYVESLRRLAGRTADFDEIWPSHGDFPIGPDVVMRLCDGAENVLAGKVRGRPAEIHGAKITAYDLGFTILLCGRQDDE